MRGVEFPPEDSLPAATPEECGRARAYAGQRGLGIVADGGPIEEAALRRWIPQAAALGAPVLRVIVSRILGGNRREMHGGWRAHLERARDALAAVRPLAEAHDVTIAVENHQDIASDELLWLCDAVGGRHIGITFDTGSTLAVGESPLGFARRVKPMVRNVHLKDYHVFLSPTGYRLSTCAIGDGVVDFPSLFALFADQPDLPMSIELGARQARHVELLDEDLVDRLPTAPSARSPGGAARRPADGSTCRRGLSDPPRAGRAHGGASGVRAGGIRAVRGLPEAGHGIDDWTRTTGVEQRKPQISQIAQILQNGVQSEDNLRNL